MNPSSSTILCIIGFKSFCVYMCVYVSLAFCVASTLHFLPICFVYLCSRQSTWHFFLWIYTTFRHSDSLLCTAIINKDTTFSIRHFLCVCTTKAIANGHCKHTHTSAPEEGQRDKYPMIVLLLSFVDSAML